MNACLFKQEEPTFTVPWIEFQDQSAWDSVLHLGRRVEWTRKTVVHRPEDDVKCVFLIRSGMVKVAAASADGLQRTLFLMGPGSILGEAALFAGKPYMHYITAMEQSVAYEFSKRVLIEDIITHHPKLSEALLTNLATKSYVMSSQVEDSVFLTVPQRVARFLYGLCLARSSLHLPLSHGMIADLLGIHRVTVSNTIGLMKRIGLLEDTTHGVTVADINALAAFLSKSDAASFHP